MIGKLGGGRWGLALGALALLLASPLVAPELLAFPYKAEVRGSTVYSETQMPPAALESVIDRAHARVATSPLAAEVEKRTIFLTDGGWRWQWLALSRSYAQAYSRPFRDIIVVNRSDLEHDRIKTFVGTRSLSSVLAHEICHGMQYREFGGLVRERKPQWLIEGYCDHVAGESSLSDEQAVAYERVGEKNMALTYWQGRKRVERELAANGGDVEVLFEEY